MSNFPHTTAILAMSADGKISPHSGTPARFSSPQDLKHLEEQISLCDAILFGANTLRAYGTTLTIKQPHLLAQRKNRQQTPQPINIVCSSSGKLDQNYRFFDQPVKRVLLTTQKGKENWLNNINKNQKQILFDDYLISEHNQEKINWQQIFNHLKAIKINHIAILGGGEIIASILAENLINDLWITLCPVILGGNQAPTPVGGIPLESPLGMKLKEIKKIEQELFLHYQIIKH
ncbi:RibD family protein [Cyanobacterium stanieri LEGE 03274]|uniref:RibD family protein n=1 Tax=Cyanobacterium stanieri LEGE 03274 TaxID=1828756 RepID=A0ABR9V6M4_9CHRO|nr:RibD family protein [Cyanobacterium stanieri]MBE9222499.1 RibD family protein [Cyanobacterium stanieri LEGE 03274]